MILLILWKIAPELRVWIIAFNPNEPTAEHMCGKTIIKYAYYYGLRLGGAESDMENVEFTVPK